MATLRTARVRGLLASVLPLVALACSGMDEAGTGSNSSAGSDSGSGGTSTSSSTGSGSGGTSSDGGAGAASGSGANGGASSGAGGTGSGSGGDDGSAGENGEAGESGNAGGSAGAGASGGGGNGGNGGGGGGIVSPSPLAPSELTVNDRARPLNLEGAPLFGWINNASDGNEVQTAYQIVVSDSDGVVWDSDKVASSEQEYVPYGGPALTSGTSYTWLVRTWDKDDQASPYSEAASFDTGISDDEWEASWIRRTTTQADDYTLARKEVNIGASPVVRARAYVSAAHVYELHVNGDILARGPAFAHPSEGYYQATDITDSVQAGAPLVIGVIYHWYGSGQGRPASERGLLVRVVVDHADGSREVIVSDASWRVTRAAQWLTGAPKRNSDVGDYVEHIDATAVPAGWDLPGFNAGSWSAPSVVGEHPAGVFTSLRGQEARLAYTTVSPVSVKTLADGAVVADFGRVMPARPMIHFTSGMVGRTLTIRGGYRLTADGHISTAAADNQNTDLSFSYAQKAGVQDFLPFTHFGWRYLQISAPGEVLDENDIKAVIEHTDAPPARSATFSSADPTLNAVFDLMQRSAIYSVQEQFVDTPTREKGQFLGDAACISYATMAAHFERDATQQAIRQFMASQVRHWGAEDRMNAVYPNGDGKRDIPDYTEIFPGWVVRYYEQTGDETLLEDAYPVMKNITDYIWSYRNGTTGLITNLAGGSGSYQYGIVDWPAVGRFGYDMTTTARTTVNVLAVNALEATAQAASVVGRPQNEIDTLKQRAASLKNAINTQLRNQSGAYVDGLLSNNSQSSHVSQHANSYAIAFGVAPSADVPELADTIAAMGMKQGPMTAHWLLKALGDADRPDAVLEFLTNENDLGWADVIEKGGTFTWESWDAGSTGQSMSHGWGAQAVVDVFETLLGVRVTSPGGATISIAPPSTGLSEAQGSVPIQRGMVSVDWVRDDDDGLLTLDVVIPVNVVATVALPVPDGAAHSASGEGSPVFEQLSNGRAIYVVGSGASHFEVGP